MCVSAEYCERNLPLLITILERSTDPIVRSNAVIALGDMAVCFNHLIDSNTDFLYRRLNDADASVKRTCLMTLTFLILAGQVKVKGQLGEMAKCLEDEDRRIAELARMFFAELATKDNAVYNHFVDMFGLLSKEGAGLEEEAFKRILRFLCGFIEKVRFCVSLFKVLLFRGAEKLSRNPWQGLASYPLVTSAGAEATYGHIYVKAVSAPRPQRAKNQISIPSPPLHHCGSHNQTSTYSPPPGTPESLR